MPHQQHIVGDDFCQLLRRGTQVAFPRVVVEPYFIDDRTVNISQSRGNVVVSVITLLQVRIKPGVVGMIASMTYHPGIKTLFTKIGH